MLRFRSYRAKLQTAFVALGLAAIAITGWEASRVASGALETATNDRLTAIASTKRRAIERYFTDLGNHVLALSTDESTVAALEGFRDAWSTVPDSAPPRLAGGATKWEPHDPRARVLQSVFAGPPADREHILAAPGTGGYDDLHRRYHPTLQRYRAAFGFYDILLIGAEDGRVLYTVVKEIDLGARLTEAPYSETSLARAYRRTIALREPELYVAEDYAPYAPSQFALASFITAPVWRRGVMIGVLAIQLSISDVNRVMTGDRRWQEEGLGQTGQSYIVGPDLTLRSDYRFEIERPQDFYKQMAAAGVSTDIVESIRRHRTAILNLPVPDDLGRSIRTGERGVHAGTDQRGVPVLRAHVPLEIPELKWTLVAEIERSEALEPVRSLQMRTLGWGVAVGLVFLAAAAGLARSVTRPVVALAETAGRLGRRDFESRMPVESEDEIGQLARAFNRMTEELRMTTVSRDELEALAARLLTAQEEERARVGRELHDDLTQRLAALAIAIGQLQKEGPYQPQALARLREEVVRLSSDVHRLSRSLHPTVLEDLGLAAAVEMECRNFFERGGSPVDLSTEGDLHAAPLPQQLALYRIVQEALRNIQRHAGADDVSLRLWRDMHELGLTIRDNGAGFDRSSGDWRPGIGLASMEERARLLGGSCQIRSKPGAGTQIEVRLPPGGGDEKTESTAGGRP